MAPRRQPSNAAHAAPPPRLELAPRVGWIAPGTGPGRVLVDWPGNAAGPVLARSLVTVDDEGLSRAAEERQPIVLLFEGGDPGLPLLVGVVQSSTPLLDAVLARAPRPATTPEDEASRRLVGARDELVLECGKASITLRRNGKVVIRGTYVETTSAGTNRIRGGSVKIN